MFLLVPKNPYINRLFLFPDRLHGNAFFFILMRSDLIIMDSKMFYVDRCKIFTFPF